MTERETKRLERISEKLEHIKAQRQDILARDRKRQRKERTRRLIQIGAVTEKYLNRKDINPITYENFWKNLFSVEGAQAKVEHVMAHTEAQEKNNSNAQGASES